MFLADSFKSFKFEGGDCGLVRIIADDLISVWHASLQLSGLFFNFSSSTEVRGLSELFVPPSTETKQVLHCPAPPQFPKIPFYP